MVERLRYANNTEFMKSEGAMLYQHCPPGLPALPGVLSRLMSACHPRFVKLQRV